ncbi:hypothetical protein OT109_13835 [Phycisphaeraceae bacterium D3-23]
MPEATAQREPVRGEGVAGRVADDLLARVMAFELDDPESPMPFTKRLARDNRWPLAYAIRVVREYRRFVFLAMRAGHTVVPSEQVDQAWHLHLLYTRSYWDGLCADVLGRPLHHGPTRGGEQHKHETLYQQTLDSYARLFDEPPPGDIWPDVHERFRVAHTGTHVYTGDYWLMPRPGVWWRRLRGLFTPSGGRR